MEDKKQKKGGNFVSTLCKTLGIIIILAVILTCLPLTVPKLLGYEIFNVETGSMSPEIPVGSVVYVKPAPPEEIEEGEVISFSRNGNVITHRVVENHVVEGEFITKGDANDTEDLEAIPYSSLIGRVIRHFPILGRLLVVYASTIGKVYVLIVAACGVMLNALGALLKK